MICRHIPNLILHHLICFIIKYTEEIATLKTEMILNYTKCKSQLYDNPAVRCAGWKHLNMI